MKKVAQLPVKDRTELFQATAIAMGLLPKVVEKDFWVCYMLDHLFHTCKYKKAFVFKGGTSLSKAYHVIERFSEDIDLILDWRELINDGDNPWDERSNRKQDLFNKQMNFDAVQFYKEDLVPQLNKELQEELGEGEWVSVDSTDEMVVNFYYPQIFETEYLRSTVRLEIGPLAEWIPSHETNIVPFAAEKYPALFSQKETAVLTIDVERTFWEKLTILHKLAHFPEGKVLPLRYARHLYDVYNLGNSWVKESAFRRKELLEKDVTFKQKFYYAKSAHYETATLSSIMLVPEQRIHKALQDDYKAMQNMIYGNMPEFEEILDFLETLQEEIHGLQDILPEEFGSEMEDGRLTEPSDGKTYNLREAIRTSEKLGRPLTDGEMKQFEV